MLLPAERIAPENAGRLTLLGVLEANTSPVRGLAWSPDGSALALSAYKDAQIWDANTGQRLAKLQGHTSEVDGIAWSPDGSMLASASRDATVRLWDARQRTPLTVLQDPATHTMMINVAWSPDSRRLASGDGNGLVQLWDASTGKNLLSRNDPPLHGASTRLLAYAVYGIGWSPDGQYVAANRYDGLLRVWEASTGKIIAIRQTLIGPNGLAWSPDGRILSVGTDTGAIQLWDTRTWNNTATLQEPGDSFGWTYAVPWSPDGRLIAASRQNALAQVWDAGAGKKLVDLRGHSNVLWAAAWSPDGLRLASGSDDGTARLWGVR
ncbi:MAG TPA: WD40 repeat domain-containing protein [Ktedonobacterales bacterium]|jgi:WD40 repeat protein